MRENEIIRLIVTGKFTKYASMDETPSKTNGKENDKEKEELNKRRKEKPPEVMSLLPLFLGPPLGIIAGQLLWNLLNRKYNKSNGFHMPVH